MKKFLALAIIVTVASALLIHRSVADAPTPRVKPAKATSAVDRLGQEVAQLRSQVWQVKANQSAAQEEEPVAPPPPAAQALPEARTVEGTVAQLEHQINSETADSQWSRDTEEEIAAVLSTQTFAGTTLVSTVCKNSLCRTEVAVADETAENNFKTHAPLTAPFNTDGFVHVTGDPEHRKMVLYSARPDTKFLAAN